MVKQIYRLLLANMAALTVACSPTSHMNMDDWKSEFNSAKTSITCQNDTLDIVSPDGNTLWYDHRLEGNYSISYKITVVDAGGEFDRLSDLNCFWGAKDPEYPDDIYRRSEFRNGVFQRYTTLELFYVGFGGNENQTTRFRKYHPEYLDKDSEKVKPVLKEYDKLPNLLEKDKWYKIEIKVKDSETTYTIDGRTIFRHPVSKGECDGYFGLRFWKNHVRCTDFKITRL